MFDLVPGPRHIQTNKIVPVRKQLPVWDWGVESRVRVE